MSDRDWTPEGHIKMMEPHAKKLMNSLKSDGYSFENNGVDRITITKGSKSHTMANHCFYRFSGMAKAMRQVGLKDGKPVHDYVKITDDMYMNEHMKSIILHIFRK
jgi:hypothetical protein